MGWKHCVEQDSLWLHSDHILIMCVRDNRLSYLAKTRQGEEKVEGDDRIRIMSVKAVMGNRKGPLRDGPVEQKPAG